jgi:D-hydroxyproline dehydrogenase subunit gamma
MSADLFQISIEGVAIVVSRGTTVAAAMMNAGLPIRASVSDQPRAALCSMGICHECRITIDGRAHQRSCLTFVQPGMVVARDD